MLSIYQSQSSLSQNEKRVINAFNSLSVKVAGELSCSVGLCCWGTSGFSATESALVGSGDASARSETSDTVAIAIVTIATVNAAIAKCLAKGR